MLIKLKPPGLRRRFTLINTLANGIFQIGVFGEVEIFLDVDEWTLEKLMARAMQANGSSAAGLAVYLVSYRC